MIYILPRRLIIDLLPLALLASVMFLAGLSLYHAGYMLCTAPKLLAAIDWLAIPSALVAGWLLLRFLGQMFQSSMEKSGGSILSAVGVKAGFALLTCLVALAAPAWMAAMGALDKAYPQFRAHSTPQRAFWLPTTQTTAPTASQVSAPSTNHGTFYIAPPVSPAPTAKPVASPHQ